MDLCKLRYAVEVDNQGSISKAAQTLYMGQPNLSKMIKELEKELGIKLFKRTTKGVCSTPQGAQFLLYAKSILSQVDELESLYKTDYSLNTNFQISVPRATYISSTFGDFIQQLSLDGQMNIRYRETNTISTLQDVINGNSDLGILRYQSVYEDYFLNECHQHALEHQTLFEFTQQLLMSKNHPLAQYQVIPYHLLGNYIELVHGDFELPGINFSNIKKGATFSEPQRKICVYDRGSQYNFLEQISGSFMWVSPFSHTILDKHNFILRPCDLANIIHKDVFIYKSNAPLPAPLKAFMEFCYSKNEALFHPHEAIGS